ncbi:MAG: hypothetical protein JW837_19085 [Sedimentisphaerales bacterium]|nr:hypothetical protein [Sedimentisphaerales bacterium]
MAKQKMPHPGHSGHLCYLNNIGMHYSSPADYKALVKDAKYLCKVCGRVAAKKNNLCKPVQL